MRPIKRVTLYKSADDWQWPPSKNLFICGDGLAKFINIPPQARQLHLAVYSRKPSRGRNVLQLIIYSAGDYSTPVVIVEGWLVRLCYRLDDYLESNFLRSRDRRDLWVSFEWS